LGESDEPFIYCGDHSNLAYECLEDSEEESKDKEGCGDDVQRNMGAADLLEWHHHKTNRRSMKDVVHNDTMPTSMGPVRQRAQLKKLHRMQKDQKKMISMNKNQPWPEKYFDRHPLRPMIKCDSHQLRKDNETKRTGRYNQLTPCLAVVKMNDMADRICDKRLNIWENGVEVPNKESPQDVEFCPFGLRFRLFVDGKEIGKSGTKMIRTLLGEELRWKGSMRDYHGIVFRVEGEIDITHIELAVKGGMARWSRGQGANIVRSMRLDNNLRWLVVMSVDGQEMSGEHTEENIKKFLCQERTEGVYDLCQLCCSGEGTRHREQLDDFNAYVRMPLEERQECGEELIRPLYYDRWDWRRGSVTHPTICGKKHLITARMMGNQVVQNRLKDLLDMGERSIDNAGRGATRSNIPGLNRFMMDELRKKELEPFISSLGSQDKKFGLVKIQREENETIMGKMEWEARINQGGLFNGKVVDINRASAALKKWREAIVFGFFLPESMNMKPIHEQCVLDTC